MFILDAHLDLSMNAMEWNRDLRKPIQELRTSEQGMTDKPDRGNGTVCFPELRKGNIGLVVATQIARYVAPGNPCPDGIHPNRRGLKRKANWHGTRRWKKRVSLSRLQISLPGASSPGLEQQFVSNSHRVYSKPRRSRLDRNAGPPGESLRDRVAGVGSRPLRPWPVCTRHRRHWFHGCSRACVAPRNGEPQHDPGRHALM